MIFAYVITVIICSLLLIGCSAISVSMLFEHSQLTAEYQPKKQDRTKAKQTIVKDFFEDDDLLIADEIIE